MFLWQRRASAEWCNAHEQLLQEMAPGRLAIIHRLGKLRDLAQIFCRRKRDAFAFQSRFGGTVEKLQTGWEKQFLLPPPGKPIRVGARLRISAVVRPDSPNDLIIPAAGAFGTGEHATTAMCLRLLEEATRGLSLGWKALDAGTGTGILALAAHRFGADSVVGLDDDPRAVAHARANARQNKIRGATFLTLDLLRWKSRQRFDLITANLFSELLISALPIFCPCLTKSGCLILSGILRGQADEVIDSLGKFGFQLEKKRRRGKWVALLATRKSKLKRR